MYSASESATRLGHDAEGARGGEDSRSRCRLCGRILLPHWSCLRQVSSPMKVDEKVVRVISVSSLAYRSASLGWSGPIAYLPGVLVKGKKRALLQ